MSSEVQHREAFETYMRAQNACVRLARQSEAVGGEYRTVSVQKAWVLWLAAIDRCGSEQAVRAQWAAEVADLLKGNESLTICLEKTCAERDSAQAEAKAAKADVARGKMALQALHYWHTEYTGREPSESVFARMAMEALCGPIPDAHALQAEINDLRYLLDTRPAMNAGLAEAYAEWTAKVYIAEHHRANPANQPDGEAA